VQVVEAQTWGGGVRGALCLAAAGTVFRRDQQGREGKRLLKDWRRNKTCDKGLGFAHSVEGVGSRGMESNVELCSPARHRK
jgi:hypothetical protein